MRLGPLRSALMILLISPGAALAACPAGSIEVASAEQALRPVCARPVVGLNSAERAQVPDCGAETTLMRTDAGLFLCFASGRVTADAKPVCFGGDRPLALAGGDLRCRRRVTGSPDLRLGEASKRSRGPTAGSFHPTPNKAPRCRWSCSMRARQRPVPRRYRCAFPPTFLIETFLRSWSSPARHRPGPNGASAYSPHPRTVPRHSAGSGDRRRARCRRWHPATSSRASPPSAAPPSWPAGCGPTWWPSSRSRWSSTRTARRARAISPTTPEGSATGYAIDGREAAHGARALLRCRTSDSARG